MFRTFLLAIVSLVSVAAAAEPTWTLSNIKVTTLCGVSATSPSEVFAAMADNSLGPGVIHSTDKAVTHEFIGPAGGMNMDIAFTPDGKVGCMATVSGLLLTQDGKTFTKAPGLTGVTQNVEAFGTQSLAATGSFYNKNTKKQANGIAVSTDGGNVWNTFDIGLNSSYIARYGAFPTDSTWYVSSGSWPASSAKLEDDISYKFSQHLNLQSSGKVDTQFAPFGKPAKKVTLGGYPGGISKTTDAGKTWTQVFDSNDSMYFNEIHCFDAEHCMAVAENESGAYGVSSSNGGKTWTTVLESEGGSLMGCRMLSQTEAWMSGGGSTKSGLTGFYYHTTDGGKTWTNTEVPQAYSMDLSFNGGVGYSAALNNGYSSIAVYA